MTATGRRCWLRGSMWNWAPGTSTSSNVVANLRAIRAATNNSIPEPQLRTDRLALPFAKRLDQPSEGNCGLHISRVLVDS